MRAQIVGVLCGRRGIASADRRPRPRMSSVSSAVSAGMWMTSNRAERVAQQPQRAGDVAAGQDEAVAARRQAVDSSCSTRRRPGKLSNVRSSRNSSSRNVDRLAAAVLGAGEERQRGVERGAGAGRRRLADRERRRGDDRLAETARAWSPSARRRCSSARSGRADRAAAAAASCGRCRSRRAAPECATATRRARRARDASGWCEASACERVDLKKRRARCQFENEIL